MTPNIKNKNTVIIIAPFWKRDDYIGKYRVERFVRWLVSENYHVTVIWSGWKDNIVKRDKWDELEIRDPLRRFTKKKNLSDNVLADKQIKKSFSLRGFIQNIVFYFDRELVWSIWVTKNAIVKNVCLNAQIAISSSPPESTHLASYLLAEKYNLKLIVDLRDGWLDEPMRTYAKRWSLKRKIEKRWEQKILTIAIRIFVTSIIWAEMLKQRIPQTENKTTILTNAYPVDLDIPDHQQKCEKSSNISLLHTGRFLGTRSTNRMSILLEPLYDVLKSKNDFSVEIILLGEFLKNEFEELNCWEQQFINTETKVVTKNRIPRNEMFKELKKANGLLLLAATKAFFPSKTFEYIKSAKPILAVTLKDSTIWRVGRNLPQIFLFDYSAQKPDYTPVEKFLNACRTGDYEYKIPEEYSEEYLSKIFLDTIKSI